jgi:hypothetical protein
MWSVLQKPVIGCREKEFVVSASALISCRNAKSNERQQHTPGMISLRELRGAMEKNNVEDPEGGAKPQSDGASAAARKDGKKSRRRKGKRGGQSRTQANPLRMSPPASPARLHAQPTLPPRHRRASASVAAGVPVDRPRAVPGNSRKATPSQPRAMPAHEGEAASGKRNRRKSRGKRGLQGRPLAQAKPTGHQPSQQQPHQPPPPAPAQDGRGGETTTAPPPSGATSGPPF